MASPLMLLIATRSCCSSGCPQNVDLALKLVAVAFCQFAWASGLWIACASLVTTSSQILFIRIRVLLELFSRPFASAFTLAVGFMFLWPCYSAGRSASLGLCTSQSLWGYFPVAGFLATVVAFFLFLVDWRASRYHIDEYNGSYALLDANAQDLQLEDLEGGAGMLVSSGQYADYWFDFEFLVCRGGCIHDQDWQPGAVYSTGVAIFLGACRNSCSIGPMMAALAIRHFFLGLSAASSVRKVTSWRSTRLLGIMCSFLSAPLGLFLGTIITSSSVNLNSSSVYSSQMDPYLQLAAACFLAFAACETLLHTHIFLRWALYFCDSKTALRALHFSALLLGAGIMPLIAKRSHEVLCSLTGQLYLEPF